MALIRAGEAHGLGLAISCRNRGPLGRGLERPAPGSGAAECRAPGPGCVVFPTPPPAPRHRPPLHLSFPFCEARPCPAQTSASPSLVGSHSQGTASGSGPGTWSQGREAALAGPAGCGPLSPPFWIAQS